jgi:hypothetical protein
MYMLKKITIVNPPRFYTEPFLYIRILPEQDTGTGTL